MFIEQMQNADSIFMQPPKSQSAVFHHHHQQQAIRSTVDHSQPCGCNNCVNTMVPSGGLTGDMRLTAAVPMHSSATPSFRQMSSMQTSEPMMTSNDANRLLSASGMQLPAAGSSVHFSTPCVGYTPSACASSRAAVNQSHQPVAIKQTDNQFMRQVGESR
jgi:hypothetical protein